jgi:hypothetical protein
MEIGPTLSVRLLPDLYIEAKNFSAEQNIPISKMLREGLAIYLKLASGKTPIEQRKLYRDEYLMLSLDLIMQQEYPGFREDLHDEAKRRVEALNVSA